MSRNIWITSDTHYGHDSIIKYSNRPFANSSEMDEIMMENHNSLVRDGDIVYHLGDVYFGGGRGADYWDSFFPKLKGRKRLILGNHDNGKDQRLLRTFQKIMVWRMFPEFGLLLSHVPLHPCQLERKVDLNVMGHTHLNGPPKGPYVSVCVELTNYAPVNIDSIRELHKSQQATFHSYL